MDAMPMRLSPQDDLRGVLEAAAAGGLAGFVVCGIGSLAAARVRFAGDERETLLDGPLEIVSLSGSLCADGVHLHIAVSDAGGRVFGGHVGHGNVVRTTAEILAPVRHVQMRRVEDARTGYRELEIGGPRPARGG